MGRSLLLDIAAVSTHLANVRFRDEADIGAVDVKHEVTQGPLDYLFRRSALN